MSIVTELDRLLDEAAYREQKAEQKSRLSRAVYESHRRRALTPDCHPLRRARLTFREDGLTVAELSDRSTVAASVIAAAESGDPVSNASWERLGRALNRRRAEIDPSYVYTG